MSRKAAFLAAREQSPGGRGYSVFSGASLRARARATSQARAAATVRRIAQISPNGALAAPDSARARRARAGWE